VHIQLYEAAAVVAQCLPAAVTMISMGEGRDESSSIQISNLKSSVPTKSGELFPILSEIHRPLFQYV
jgi:hypothetical protein